MATAGSPIAPRLPVLVKAVPVLVLLAAWASACVGAGQAEPTLVFPTQVPTAAPVEDTPAITGACTLLTRQVIAEVMDVSVSQASSTPLSCGYAHEGGTVVLTLAGRFVWDNYAASFSASDSPVELPGLGQRALYFPATLNGLLMVQDGEEIYLLSGATSQDFATQLMQRILAKRSPATPG